MRSSGGVYQPTTTGLPAADKSWTGARFLGPGGTTTSSRGWPKSMVLILAGLFGAMGLVMVIVGAKWHSDLMEQTSNREQWAEAAKGAATAPGTNGNTTPSSPTPYITILVVGILLMVVAFVGLIAYYRSIGAALPCCPGKIVHIRQRLHDQNKQSSSRGPMSAQYHPPGGPATPSSLSPSSPPSSTTSHLPPLGAEGGVEPPFTDVSEQQRLMGEDTERMLDDDPRIVLSPLKSHEEC